MPVSAVQLTARLVLRGDAATPATLPGLVRKADAVATSVVQPLSLYALNTWDVAVSRLVRSAVVVPAPTSEEQVPSAGVVCLWCQAAT